MLKTLQKDIVTDFNNNKLPNDAAGSLMVTDIPVILQDASIGEIKKNIHRNISSLETIDYIYVVNKNTKLIGVVSVKDLFRFNDEKNIAEMIKGQKPAYVNPETDQEHVALLALRKNIKAVPVADKKGRLLGVITSNVILNVLNSEGVEDLLLFAGVHNVENYATKILRATTKEHFRKRLPWLAIGLFGGLIAAFVVNLFEGTLQEEILLAAFIPLVVYMADAVGAQTQTIFVRSIALDYQMSVRNYITREIKTGLLLAFVLSILLAFIAVAGWQSMMLSFVLGISLFSTIMVAIAVGILLPWAFDKKGYDPAITSGPFATIVIDIISVVIYLSIAFLSLSLFA